MSIVGMSVPIVNRVYAEAFGYKLFPVQSASVKSDTDAVLVVRSDGKPQEINFVYLLGYDHVCEELIKKGDEQ